MTDLQNAAQFIQSPEARRYLRMLAVLAAPIANRSGDAPDNDTIDVWREWQQLQHATQQAHDLVADRGAPWAVVRLVPPVAQSLRDALAPDDPAYQVVHISCHGEPDGVILEDPYGREALITTSDLAAALQGDDSRSPVQLVVLNACDTQAVGQALLDVGVRCVICVDFKITPTEAEALTARLYRRLASRATVQAALEEARRAVREIDYDGKGEERADRLRLLGDGSARLTLDGPAAPEPYFLLDPTPHNQATEFAKRSTFVGRHSELLQLARWLVDRPPRSVFAISGIGGVGKTTLAMHAALRHAHGFRGIVLASAKGKPNFGVIEVRQAIDAALPSAPDKRDESDPIDAVARRLNSRPILLILDNLETVAAERCGDLAEALRRVDPLHGSRVLMTLRPNDRSPLTKLVAATDRINLEELDDVSAIRMAWNLLAESWDSLKPEPPAKPPIPAAESARIVQQARLSRALTSEESSALHHFVRLARLHPGLIEIAAPMAINRSDWIGTCARLDGLKGKEITEAYSDFIGQALDALTQEHPGTLAVFHALLPFAGGATEAWLRTVTLGEEHDDTSDAAIDFADERLTPALATALLRRANARYDLDEPVRAFVSRRRPPTAAERDEYAYRHATIFLPIVEGYDNAHLKQSMSFSAPYEWSNVAVALDWLAGRVPDDERACRLLVAYSRHWRNTLVNGFDPRREHWLAAALQAAQRLNSQGDEANTLLARGDVQRFRDDYTAALTSYQQALTLFQAVGDRLGEANTRKARGDVQQFRGDRDAALQSYQQALTLFQAVGDRLGEANTLRALGHVQRFRDDYTAALTSYQQALTLFQAVGDRLGEANVYAALSRLVIDTEPERSQQLLEQALALRQAIGDVYDAGADLGNYGIALLQRDRTDEAIGYLERARELFASRGLEAQVKYMDDLIAQAQRAAAPTIDNNP